mgnify:CR=1 FL=1
MKNKLEFEVEGKKYIVKKPSVKNKSKGDLVYAKSFNEALKAGAILRSRLSEYCIEQGVTTPEKQVEKLNMLREVEEDRKKLLDPELKPEEGRQIVDRINLNITSYRLMRMTEIELDQTTAEAIADDARFNYLISCCTVTDENIQCFKDVDDYLQKVEDGDEIAKNASVKFAALVYNTEESEAERPENVYMKKLEEVKPPEDILPA